MMNFVQQQEDLYDFDDQSLVNELQSGMRGYHPMVVAAEMQRRMKERDDAQRQMLARQAQQNQPVAEQQLAAFMAQAQPAQMPQEGMPPEMAMQGGAEGMPPEMMAAAMPPAMPAEVPVGIASAMPQQMAGGGIVRRAQTGLETESPAQRRIRISRELNKALRTGASPERIRDLKLQLEVGGSGRMSEGALRSMGLATDPRLFQPIMRTYDVKMDQPEFDLTLPQDRPEMAPAEAAAETVAETRVPPTGRGVTSLPTYSPSSFDFGGAYQRNLADLELQPVTIRSPRATEQSVRDASFFTEEMGRLSKFAPDKERFQKESQSDLLVGLGSVIAGATQRGDIAKGLAQLAAQQREARRGFREEEMRYAGLESALRREGRAERKEEQRERRQIEREDEASAAARRQEARQMTVLQMEAQKQIDDANYKIQDLAQRIDAAKAKAATEGMTAQVKLLLDTLNMQLRQEQIKKTRAETAKIEAEAAEASRFKGTGATPAGQVFAQ